jgi:hypothetical protein
MYTIVTACNFSHVFVKKHLSIEIFKVATSNRINEDTKIKNSIWPPKPNTGTEFIFSAVSNLAANYNCDTHQKRHNLS